jgi:hypothetical protein
MILFSTFPSYSMGYVVWVLCETKMGHNYIVDLGINFMTIKSPLFILSYLGQFKFYPFFEITMPLFFFFRFRDLFPPKPL